MQSDGANDRHQTWDPERYARNAGFVPKLGADVLQLLNPQSGERILDLGCGDGVLTESLLAAGAEVVGIDSSPEQVAAARARGIDAREADGSKLEFNDEFDAVFSNAALHWMNKPEAVANSVATALHGGGRFVGEFGGAGNCQIIRSALYDALGERGLRGQDVDPWYFPSPAEYTDVLQGAGFDVASMVIIPRPTPLPGALSDWLVTFTEPFLSLVDEGERDHLIAEVSTNTEAALRGPDGTWKADYVRLRFDARL
jgi:trans-aconitate methyltransferase